MRCEAGIWGYHQSKEVQNNKKCEAIEKLIDLHISNIFNSKGTAWWLLIPLMIEIVSTYKCQRSASTFAILALLEFRPNHITCQNHAQMKPNSLPKVWHKKLHSHLKRRKDVEIRIAQSSWGEHQWEEDTAVDYTSAQAEQLDVLLAKRWLSVLVQDFTLHFREYFPLLSLDPKDPVDWLAVLDCVMGIHRYPVVLYPPLANISEPCQNCSQHFYHSWNLQLVEAHL